MSAHWAVMAGLGVEGAMEVVDSSNDKLRAKLQLTADMSRSAMWDLRHAIDGGQIFRGGELGEVLEAHAATFSAISSVPAELVRHGTEVPLATITRSLLVSIAHRALTNVIRYARSSAISNSPMMSCACPSPTTASGFRRTMKPEAMDSGTCGQMPRV